MLALALDLAGAERCRPGGSAQLCYPVQVRTSNLGTHPRGRIGRNCH
jgi:hypothetical protein